MKNMPTTIVTVNGKEYVVNKIENPIDVSENNQVEHPTYITHYIDDFDERIYVAFEYLSDTQQFVFFLYQIEGTSLFLAVDPDENEEAYDLLLNIVFAAIEKYDDELNYFI